MLKKFACSIIVLFSNSHSAFGGTRREKMLHKYINYTLHTSHSEKAFRSLFTEACKNNFAAPEVCNIIIFVYRNRLKKEYEKGIVRYEFLELEKDKDKLNRD